MALLGNKTTTFVAIDFETANWNRWSACAVGMVRVERGCITRRVSRLIRPPTSDFAAAHVHGITSAHVAGSPGFAQVWRGLAPMLRGAAFLAAHNAAFDRQVLVACAERFGVLFPDLPFRCSMRLARSVWQLPRVSLPTVARFLGIPLAHHDPLSDAEACARIVLAADDGSAPLWSRT